MRDYHMNNPLHRITRWTGTYFRHAELWEVGVYLQIPHEHNSIPCQNNESQIDILRDVEASKDLAERRFLMQGTNTNSRADASRPGTLNANVGQYSTAALQQSKSLLQALQTQMALHNNINEFTQTEVEDKLADESENIPDSSFTRQSSMPTQCDSRNSPVTPTHDIFNQRYVRVVHVNGIHHLPILGCACHGEQQFAFDLVAAGLLPSSFTKIRTLFTSAILDHFRLANLELKASAYQYYSLLRRITSATAPSSVVNVAHEFRRMVRIWRWIKKLQWAGYGYNHLDANNPPKASLANFCAACPQPGVNLAQNWKDDPNRYIFFYGNANLCDC